MKDDLEKKNASFIKKKKYGVLLEMCNNKQIIKLARMKLYYYNSLYWITAIHY